MQTKTETQCLHSYISNGRSDRQCSIFTSNSSAISPIRAHWKLTL